MLGLYFFHILSLDNKKLFRKYQVPSRVSAGQCLFGCLSEELFFMEHMTGSGSREHPLENAVLFILLLFFSLNQQGSYPS